MAKHKKDRLSDILKVAKNHFLKHGFKDASLRTIAKEAGITTGAVYIYFKSKEEIFDALVKDAAEGFLNMYQGMETEFQEMPMTEKFQEFDIISLQTTSVVLDYLYKNFDEFKLICFCSEGTEYENYLDRLINLELETTYSFVRKLTEEKNLQNNIDKDMVRILVSIYLNGITELIKYNVKPDKAKIHMANLAEFCAAGWKKLLKI